MTLTSEQDGGIWIFDRTALPEGWAFDRLGNRCTVRRGASPRPAGHPKYFGGGTIPWIKIGDATRTKGRFIEGTEEYVNEEGANHSVRIPAGSLIVANSGVSLGFAAFTRMHGCIHDGWLLLTQFRDLDPQYVYYCVNIATRRIRQLADGTTQPNLNTDIARRLVLPLPPLPEQRRIAEVLSCLDDKIELNQRVNETLEAMARALYTDWFIDFGPTRAKMEGRAPYLAPEIWALFPERLDDEDKPEGWKVMQLAEIAEQCKGSVIPSNQPHQLYEHYSMPSFDIGQVPAADLGESIKSNKTPVPKGVVLLSKLNPEISRVWIPNEPGASPQIASTEFLIFKAKAPAGRGLLYCLFRSFSFRQIIEGMVTGTSKSHQRISPPALLKTDVFSGSRETVKAFEIVVSPILADLLVNRTQSRTLSQARDLLLPKLMSGEIRLRDAEKLSEKVL